MADHSHLRRTMVDNQLRTFDVTDRALLAAMEEVPRERFVPPTQTGLAYLDRNIPVPGPVDDPRVVLAPMVLARLIQALDVTAGARVLDVADAYGYAAAVLTRLGAKVTCLDDRADLAEAVSSMAPGADVRRLAASPAQPPAETGRFDAILLNGAAETRPAPLLDLLDDGGRLACIMSDGRTGKATLFVRSGDAIGFRTLFDAFAPTLAALRPAPAFQF